jgi:hypothetical protein
MICKREDAAVIPGRDVAENKKLDLGATTAIGEVDMAETSASLTQVKTPKLGVWAKLIPPAFDRRDIEYKGIDTTRLVYFLENESFANRDIRAPAVKDFGSEYVATVLEQNAQNDDGHKDASDQGGNHAEHPRCNTETGKTRQGNQQLAHVGECHVEYVRDNDGSKRNNEVDHEDRTARAVYVCDARVNAKAYQERHKKKEPTKVGELEVGENHEGNCDKDCCIHFRRESFL